MKSTFGGQGRTESSFLGMLTPQISNLQERAFSNFIQRLETAEDPSPPDLPVVCLQLQKPQYGMQWYMLTTQGDMLNTRDYIRLLAKEVRHRVKSPAKRAKPVTNTGIGTLPNGAKFIKYWPTHRKPADLRTCPRQSLTDAARWCKEVPTHSRSLTWNLKHT